MTLRRRVARVHDSEVPVSRAALIQDLEVHHIAPGFPRLQLSLMIAIAGLAGFLTAVSLLRAGVEAMWVRYPLAVLAAYVGLLALLRLWIAWHRGWTPDAELPSGGPDHSAEVGREAAFGGGRSGGAGGGATWGEGGGPRTAAVAPRRSGSALGDLSLDADDGWWLILAGVLVLGGAVAVLYVVYIAPILLAEVALDAALVTAVYRRLRPHDAQHWAVGVARQTWIPATVLALCLSGAGFALQQVAPEARSIGGVVAHLRR